MYPPKILLFSVSSFFILSLRESQRIIVCLNCKPSSLQISVFAFSLFIKSRFSLVSLKTFKHGLYRPSYNKVLCKLIEDYNFLSPCLSLSLSLSLSLLTVNCCCQLSLSLFSVPYPVNSLCHLFLSADPVSVPVNCPFLLSLSLSTVNCPCQLFLPLSLLTIYVFVLVSIPVLAPASFPVSCPCQLNYPCSCQLSLSLSTVPIN